MMTKKPTKKEEPKFPAMSPEEIAEDIKRQEQAKQKYSVDAAEVEEALTDYLKIRDPIVHNGKAIAWVRRPSMKELKELIPKEMMKYMNTPDKVPESVLKKYQNFFYEKMEDLIVVPKYTAAQWEAKANPWLIRKFWDHIGEIVKLMEGSIEGF